MRSFEQSLVKMRVKILGVAADMDRGPVFSGTLPTLSCAQVQGREVCLSVTYVPEKQWTVHLEQDLKSKARPSHPHGAQWGWKKFSITWLDLKTALGLLLLCATSHPRLHKRASVAFVLCPVPHQGRDPMLASWGLWKLL